MRKYAIFTVRTDLDCLVVIITARIFPLSNSFVKMMQPANLGHGSDIEMYDFASMMTNHDKIVKDPESSSWHSKEIKSGNIFDMVFKEGLPCLRRRVLLLDHIVRNSCFTNIITRQF